MFLLCFPGCRGYHPSDRFLLQDPVLEQGETGGAEGQGPKQYRLNLFLSLFSLFFFRPIGSILINVYIFGTGLKRKTEGKR